MSQADRGGGTTVSMWKSENSNTASCNVGQTDTGKTLIGGLADAMALAVAGINTAVAIYFATKQYDIAKGYLDIAKWWRSFYETTYKPWEDKELDEAWQLVNWREEPNYDVAMGRAKTYGRIEFRGIAEKSIQCTSEYCTGLREALLKDAIVAEAAAMAALPNMGYRTERAYVEARNDVRWQRLTGVIKRGRNMMADNVQFSQLSFGIFGALGKQASAAAGGALKYLGYTWNKNDTQFPTMGRGMAVTPQPTASAPSEGPTTRYTSGITYYADSAVGQSSTR